jgi:hypothetical protein
MEVNNNESNYDCINLRWQANSRYLRCIEYAYAHITLYVEVNIKVVVEVEVDVNTSHSNH